VICTSRPRSLRISFVSWLPGTAERSCRPLHAHHDLQHVRYLRAAIDEVAEENRLASFRMVDFVRSVLSGDLVSRASSAAKSSSSKQPVDVADDVEWDRVRASGCSRVVAAR
jgi:hypothetical protein